MAEIARLTQVSQPTVSRVLNGSTNVRPEIRERVLRCAREHDYQVNVLARSLQGSKTKLLGVLVTDLAAGFYAELAKQIELAAHAEGYSVLLFNTDSDPAREIEALETIRRYRVDGAILAPQCPTDEAFLRAVGKLDVPVISVIRPLEGHDSIYFDQEAIGGSLAAFLHGRGYERLLYLGGDDERYRGIAACGPVAQCSPDGLRDAIDPAIRTAVVAGSDLEAMRAMNALHSLGLSIPEQVGVIGLGDSAICPCLEPTLTSIAQPVGQMAELAVTHLFQRINGADTPAQRYPLDGTLVLRESV